VECRDGTTSDGEAGRVDGVTGGTAADGGPNSAPFNAVPDVPLSSLVFEFVAAMLLDKSTGVEFALVRVGPAAVLAEIGTVTGSVPMDGLFSTIEEREWVLLWEERSASDGGGSPIPLMAGTGAGPGAGAGTDTDTGTAGTVLEHGAAVETAVVSTPAQTAVTETVLAPGGVVDAELFPLPLLMRLVVLLFTRES
jgi:hypothetical protein